jgi:hypothetical protein
MCTNRKKNVWTRCAQKLAPRIEEAVPKAKNMYAKNNWHQQGQAQTTSKTKRDCTKQSPKPRYKLIPPSKKRRTKQRLYRSTKNKPRKNKKNQGTDYNWSKTASLQHQQRPTKDNLPLSDPLIRPLDRKQPEEHTSHHYLVVLAALRLCWVLITQSHSQENYLTTIRRLRQAVKEKKEKWSGRYLSTQQVRLARQPEGKNKDEGVSARRTAASRYL